MNFDPAIVLPWVLKCAWLFILIQWVDIVYQLIAIKGVSLPGDIAGAESAKGAADRIPGGSMIGRRARALLSAYAAGWSPSDLAELAGHHSRRSDIRNRAAGLFMLLVFAACIGAGVDLPLPWIGIAALGATMFARSLLLGRIENVLDADLITRLPANLPGVGFTAADLGQSLGASIENAFKLYVPQPEKVTSAMTSAMESVRKSIEETSAQLKSSLTGGGDKLSANLATSGDKLTSGIQSSGEKLAAGLVAGGEKLISGLSGSGDKIVAGLNGSGEKLVAGLNSGTDKLAATLSNGAEKIQSSLGGAAQQIEKANASLASQVEKLMAASANIEKLLHATQSIEGALKSVSTSEEFKKTLSSLQTHLAESDKLIREASRPRTIKLVEHDGEISAR